jgi:hypothetical protein
MRPQVITTVCHTEEHDAARADDLHHRHVNENDGLPTLSVAATWSGSTRMARGLLA